MNAFKVLTLVKELNEDFEILLKGFDCEIVTEHADDVSVIIFGEETNWDELSLKYHDKDIAYIALKPPKNLREFFDHGGRIVLNQDLLGINIFRAMLQRALGQSSSLRIEEAFGSYLENMNSLKLVDHLGLGVILDKIGMEAWGEDYHIVDIRSFMMSVCTYLCYLKQTEICYFPISIDFGHTEEAQIIQISASVENFHLEYIWEGFEYGHSRRIPSRVLLGEALSHCDLMDVYYEERGRKIVITGGWINSSSDIRTGYGNILISHIDRFSAKEQRWKGFRNHPDLEYEGLNDSEVLELREKELPGAAPELLRGDYYLKDKPGLIKRLVKFVMKIHSESGDDKKVGELNLDEIKTYISKYPNSKVVAELVEGDYEVIAHYLRDVDDTVDPDEETKKAREEVDNDPEKAQNLFSSLMGSLGRISVNDMEEHARVGGFQEEVDDDLVRVEGHEKSVYNEEGKRVSGGVTFDGEKFIFKGGDTALDEDGNYWVPGNGEGNQTFKEGEVFEVNRFEEVGEEAQLIAGAEEGDQTVEHVIGGDESGKENRQSLAQKVAEANAQRKPGKAAADPTYRFKSTTQNLTEDVFVIAGGADAWNEKKTEVLLALQEKFGDTPPQGSAEIQKGLAEILSEKLDIPEEMTESISSSLIDDSLFDGMDIDIDDRFNDVLGEMEDKTPPHLKARNEQIAKAEGQQVDKMKTVMERMKTKMIDMAGLQSEFTDVAEHLDLENLENLEDAKAMLAQVKERLAKLPQDPNRFVTKNEVEVKEKKLEFLEKMVENLKGQVEEEKAKAAIISSNNSDDESANESINLLKSELKTIGEQHDRFKSEMEKQVGLKSEYISNLEEKLNALKQTSNADNTDFETKGKLVELEQENRKLERQLEDVKLDLDCQKSSDEEMISVDEVQGKERKIDYLKEENDRLNDLMKALDKEKNDAIKELDTMETSVERLQEELQEERNKDSAEAREDQIEEMETLKEQLGSKDMEITQKKMEVDKANASTKEEQINVKRLEQKLKLMNGQLAAQTKKAVQASGNRTMASDSAGSAGASSPQIKRLEALNKKLKENHQKAVSDLTEKKKNVIQLETEVRQLKQTITGLEKKVA